MALGHEAASLSLRSDCKDAVDGSAQLIGTIETGNDPSELVNFNGINADLWIGLRMAIAKHGMREVGKVKAHSSIHQVTSGEITMQEFVGNHVADVLAKAAAHLSSNIAPVRKFLSRNAS